MATGLQCPTCGHKHRITELDGATTFECVGCGRALKTPGAYRAAASSGGRAAPSAASGNGPGTARLPAVGAPKPSTSPKPARSKPAVSSPAASSPADHHLGFVTLPLRIAVWVVAIGLGAAIAFGGARIVGFLSTERLIDMFSGDGVFPYLRLIAIVPVWALMSAVLAHLMIEGARAVVARRARRDAGSARVARPSTGPPRPAPAKPAPSPKPVPSPPVTATPAAKPTAATPRDDHGARPGSGGRRKLTS